MSLRASIIINTYNRASYLQRLLVGLGHLKGVEFEVIVVNGPSTDDTASLLEKYKATIKTVDCPTRNLSHSRNLGIAAAAGDIVVFIDDDALPCSIKWLGHYIEAYQNNAKLGAAGGAVLIGDTDYMQFNGGMTSEYGIQLFKTKKAKGGIAPDGSVWNTGVQGCNCSFHRIELVKIGGFDETYKYYLDETDVCIRIARAGYSVEFLDGNGVRHYYAASERRTSHYDRNWDIITKSDTYFALKNGRDAIFKRLLKTLLFAPKKHFVREIDDFFRKGEISRSHWLRLKWQWLTGLFSGLWTGLAQKRRLGNFSTPPPPFLPFQPNFSERSLCIALLTQTVPGQASYGGIGRYTYDLARGLHERGHEVHILCRDEKNVHYESLGFVIHGLPSAKTTPQQLAGQRPILNKNLTYALAVERKLAELYSQGIEFDVVHASNWDAEAVAVIRERIYPTALMLVTPLAQVIQTEKWTPNADLNACVALDRWQIEHANVVCVPSKGVLKSYQTLMGLEPEKLGNLQVTPLGIVPAAIASEELKSQRKHHYKLLFVGRLEWRKGVHTLLNALPDLMPRFPNWECHFVGDDTVPAVDGNTFKQAFIDKYPGAPWLERVIFHGILSEAELRHHYQTCDLFVAPSLFESFGLIFQEAMQYGKAVVGCRTGGIPEVVAHGVEGLLVSPDTPNELCDALAQLMQDDKLRESMGKAGKQRIQERDNYQAMAVQLEKVYQSLVQAKGEEYRARRKDLWPRELPLLDSKNFIHWIGPWELRETAPNQIYCKGVPGASLEFTARPGSRLELTARRHPSGGVLEVSVNGTVLQYIDLYSQNQELDYVTKIQVPGQGGELIEVKLLTHTERNPKSLGNEIWLKRVNAVSA